MSSWFEKTVRRSITTTLGILASLAFAACGGGSGSGSDTGGMGQLSAQAFWQQRSSGAALSGITDGPGFGAELPAAVQTVRLDFVPSVGEACCVAIDPNQVPVDPDSGRRSVVLTMIPAGPGNLTIAGFPGAIAAAPPGVFATCELEPADAASPCEVDALEGPSFLSEPTAVAVRANDEVNAGDILVPAVPFFISDRLQPAPGSAARSPFALGATVGFAGDDLPVDTIVAATTPGGNVPLTLSFCDDAGDTPCSAGGSLDVRGLRAEGVADLPTGNAAIEFAATGFDGPPLTVAYQVSVSPADSPTPSPTNTGAPSTSTPIPSATRSPSATRIPTSTPTNRPPATRTNTRTPQATNTPGPPTATPNVMCGAVPEIECRQSIEGNRSTFIFSKQTNPDNNRLLWRWERGNFTERRDFGDPGLTTSYALCIYDEIDGQPTLVRQLLLPPGPDCTEVATACWRVTDDGFRYDDESGTRDGIEQLDLVAGIPGQAEIRFRAGGRTLVQPQLPFEQDQTVTVQLKNDFEGGHCWEAAFSRPSTRNDFNIFRDTGDNPSTR